MKNKIDRMKTPAMHLSKRTVALILSVIMLVSSIATGSMLNTFAAYIKDNAAKTDAIADAASEGSAIAESAIPSEDDSPDAAAPDFIPNEVVRNMKDDLAAVSANVDVADTTATGDWYIVGNVGGVNNWSERDAVKLSAVTGGYSISIQLTKNGDFRLRHNSLDYGAASSSDSDRKVDSSSSNKTLSQSNQTFIWNGDTGTYTVSINSDGSKISFDSSVPGGGTSPTSAPSGSIGTKVTDADLIKILNGTDVSFYIESYTDKEWTDLCNSSKSTPTYTRYGKIGTRYGKAYVQIAKTDRTSYDRITNNKSDWDGDENTAIKTATGGEHFVKNGTGNVSAVGSTTTINSSYQTTDTMSIVTKSNATKTAFTENSAKVFDMTIKYYIQSGNDFYHIDEKDYTATTSNKTQSYALSGLSAGNYKLITLAVDSEDYVRYIADSDNFTVTAEAKHAVTFNTSGSGTVTPASGTEVGESTPTTITATPAYGYEFTGWTFGNGITGASTSDASTTIKTKSSGTYTVTANFALKSLSVNKGTHANGDFTLSTTTGVKMGDTITISNIAANKGYTFGSISTSPSTALSGSGSSRTFTMPGEDVTVNAIFSPKTGNTITRTASPNVGGTVYCGTSSNTTSTTGNYTTGNTLYVRAAEKAGYDFNKIVVTYADGTTDESTTTKYIKLNTDGSKFSSENDGSIKVDAYFTKKPTHKVTVVSNNNALGTATASVTEAYEGQTVTLTPKEDTGSFSSWSVTSGGVSVSNNKFNMGSSDVTITATFVAYSGTSNFYYNSYGSDGQPASSRYGAQMQKAKIGGVEYSYYHVSGRTESDQLFTVSYESPKYDSYNTYFSIYSSWESAGVKALFYATDGKNLGDWADMTYDGADSTDKKKFRISIPDGARSVRFKNGAGSDETNELFFTSGYNAWYHSGSGFKDVTGYDSSNPVETDFWENFNSTKYTDAFESKGFNNHNANRGESHAYTKPKDLGAYSGDYYILVLEKGKTYTINGKTKTITNDPEIIWLPELPDSGDTIKVYAKDGAIAGEGQTYADLADTTVLKADGTTSAGATKYTSYGNQTYEVYKAQPGETITIKTTIGLDKNGNVLTSPTAASLRQKYYVRGFMVNGEVPKNTQITEKDTTNGVYTLTYTVPEDYEGKYIEITPVYFLVDTSANPVVTFRATNFPKGQHKWGDTPYVYPFYGDLGGFNNAFGVYAGQPMFFYNGQYTMQIPQKSTAWALDEREAYGSKNNKGKTLPQVNETPVAGITMSNGYYDVVHKLIMGYGDNNTSADHVQTYDYGDFYKIFNEKKPVDNIVFDFKYRTKKHNLTDIITSNTTASSLESKYGTGGNGFELLTNFHGRNVDLFGTPLSGDAADPSKTTPVYVVSTGGVIDNTSGVENIAGYYATEWVVYGNTSGTTYQRITGGGKNSIPPEVLVLNDDDTTSFNNTTYPSADANHNVTDWKAMYTELKQYAGHPVMISYEAADAQQGQGMYYTGTGGATRNDGRWLYSKNGENITSNIRIDVSHNSGATYVENPASGESGHVDGLSAYFTNADAYQKMTYATTIDPDKTFDFEAKTTNASYKFVGWYMADGTKITSDNVSHTERSGSYTFVARFMEVSSGQLTLSHSVDTGEIVRVDGHDYTCDGSGSAKIGAVITDADTNEVLRTFDLSSSDITIPEKYIGNDKNYNITVTLEATADTNTAYGTSKLANTDASSVTEARFFNPKTPTTSGKTTTYTFTFNVKDDLYNGTTQRALALTYHSYFIQYKFNYQINYTFNDRNGETQQYKRIGTLTPGEANTYVKKVDSSRYLDKSFIEKMAPYESNFGQDITWDFDDYLISTGGEDGSNYEYAIKAHYTATQSDLNKRNITFALPYQHNNGVAVMNEGVGTKATTKNLEFIEVKDSEGTVTADNRVDFNTIPVLPNSGENGIFTEEGKKNWIAAPATITDGSATYNFQYWSVKPTDRSGENDPDVARCYFQGFNFVAYDNYIITPVYGASTVEPSDFGKNTNITYVETTRNQWNSNGTDYAKTQTSYAADLLYNDFIIAYNYDGKDIYSGDANADIAELGVVVERIQKLEIKDDGSYDTTLSRYTGIAPDIAGVDAAIASETDINLSVKNKISKHAIDPTSLDNKNRIQFYNGIYNSAGWVQNSEGGQPAQNYAYKNYVYRAYSYMKLKDGTVIKSAVPAYFTMYDVATADLNNSN